MFNVINYILDDFARKSCMQTMCVWTVGIVSIQKRHAIRIFLKPLLYKKLFAKNGLRSSKSRL